MFRTLKTKNTLFSDQLIPHYFDEVCKNIGDTVVKLIVFNMIDRLHHEMSVLLLNKYHKHNNPTLLFEEDSNIVEERKRLKSELAELNDAHILIAKINIGETFD